MKIFIIAGEASGDWLGAKLIRELKDKAEFHGIGGTKMQGEGLKSIFPMQEISLMGFAEILPHLPTAPENSTNSFSISAEYWADHDEELTQRFNNWLAQ